MRITVARTRDLRDSPILWGALLFSLIAADYFNEVAILDHFIKVARVLTGLIILLILASSGRRFRITVPALLLILTRVVYCISTVLNDLSMLRIALPISAMAVCLVILIDYMFSRSPMRALKTILFVLEIYVYINFATVILFPNGLYNVQSYLKDTSGNVRRFFFLGQSNTPITYILPMLIITVLLLHIEGARIRYYADIAVCVVSELFIWSATSLVAIAVFFILLLYLKKYRYFRTINVNRGLIAVIVFEIGLLSFQLASVFEPFLMALLNRSATLFGRINLWGTIIKYFLRKPWLGYGAHDFRIGMAGIKTSYAHNWHMETLYEGGIVEALFFIILFICISRILSNEKKEYSSNVLTAGMIALFVRNMTDCHWICYLTIMLAANGGRIAELERSLASHRAAASTRRKDSKECLT